MTVQPDLFGELGAREARAAKLAEVSRQPQTCPSCGTVETNGYTLSLNHGYHVTADGIEGIGGFPVRQHPIYGASCLAQDLVCSHIINAIRSGDTERIARDMQRGRELGLDVEAITAPTGRAAA